MKKILTVLMAAVMLAVGANAAFEDSFKTLPMSVKNIKFASPSVSLYSL